MAQTKFSLTVIKPGLHWPNTLGGSEPTDTELADTLLQLHKINRLKVIFVSHTHHDHVMAHNINFIVQIPRTSVEL